MRQDQLPGMEHPRLKLDQRWTFATLVTPQNAGIEREPMVPEEALRAADPEMLRTSLVDVGASANAVGYISGDTRKEIKVALTPEEYTLIVRSAPALGNQALNKTLTSRYLGESFDTDMAASRRSGVHVLQAKREAMQRYVAGTLEPDASVLKEFIKYSSHSWYTRKENVDMRSELDWIRKHIFGDMLLAAAVQRGWKRDKVKQTRDAIDWRLFFDRGRNAHIRNWQEMLSLAQDYNGHKTALFKDRIWQAKRYIKKHGQ